MSKIDKLITRFKNVPCDFTYEETKALLFHFGYEEDNRGRTSGSRVAFVQVHSKHIIRLHKPNPGNVLRKYQINELIETLERQGVI